MLKRWVENTLDIITSLCIVLILVVQFENNITELIFAVVCLSIALLNCYLVFTYGRGE